jgi:silicon transporter
MSGASDHDVPFTPVLIFKWVYSTIALIFSCVIIMVLIFDEASSLGKDVHPGLAVVVFWAAVLWLTMVEGSQASLVGLPPVDKELYKDSHPISYKLACLIFKGDNLDRYLMGRQFMVLLIVFVINMSGGPAEGSEVFGWPETFQQIFLGSGLAMILTTANIGQLMAQVNASHCMIDYINNYFAVFTIYTAMAIEFSGIMHASYLIQYAVAALAGKPVESEEGPRTAPEAVFFWVRALMSTVICGFAFAVIFKSLFDGHTTVWDGLPEVVALILFFVLLSVVGMLEGMQIAFFAVAKLSKSEQGQSKFSKMTCKLLFKGNGKNLPGFMVGRQLCVVTCFFVVARVTTLKIPDDKPNIFGISDGFQEFLSTGLHAAVVTTVVGSISWQLVASAFPFMFLSNPLTYVLLRICLLFEATGICCAAWFLAKIHKNIAGFQYDEVYIGTPEDRIASGKGPEESVHVVPGSIAGAGFPKKPGSAGMRIGDYEDTVHGPPVTNEA